MIKSADGSAGLLHKITKLTAWRGGFRRCQADGSLPRKRGNNWQSIGNVTLMHNIKILSFGRRKLKKFEEDLPRLNGAIWRLHMVKTGVGCDGFHPKVLLDLTRETRGEVVDFLEKVEQSAKRPQQAYTTMFFLSPKNGTSERPIALMPTLIRWWEALREHLRWRSGSRSTALIGTLLMAESEELREQCEKLCWRWRGSNNEQEKKNWEQWHWCWTWQGHSSGSVSLWFWSWATHFAFRRKILPVLCLYFEHQRRVQFDGCVAEPLRPSRPFSRVEVELLAPTYCVAGCAESSFKNLPH